MNLIVKRKKSHLQERNKTYIDEEEEEVRIPVAVGLSAVGIQFYPPVCQDLM